MNQQPDKFFRDKLYGYERQVSPQAWKRISANRNGGSTIKWLAIAATILLLAVAGVLIFAPVSDGPPRAIADENNGEKNNNPAQSDRIPPTNQQPVAAETPQQQGVAPAIQTEKSTALRKVDTPKNVDRRKSPEAEHHPADAAEASPALAEIEPESSKEQAANNNEPDINRPLQSERQTVTIIFSAEEVNEKYLNKSAAIEATSPAKESSTIQKLLDKAYDLKHNQDPLGELRQKKNEILALNFRGERQQTEN